MWRRVSPFLFLILVIALFGGFAWLTRNPHAEVVQRAEKWPIVGPLTKQFRAAYPQPRLNGEQPAAPMDTPSKRPAQTTPEIEYEYELVPTDTDPEVMGARPIVWVEPGTPIYAEQDTASDVLHVSRALANLLYLQAEGDWYRVRVLPLGQDPIYGWVYLQNYQHPSASRLSEPDPVLPVPARPGDGDRVEAARRLMTDGGVELVCGPHVLHTDALYSPWISLCPTLVGELERVYEERYGLAPVSAAAESIFLFADSGDYLAFRDQEEIPFESTLAHSYPARGYVALYSEGRSEGEILSTLVHELTHLRSRRSIGPALPPWLAEGIADDLGESKIDGQGQISAGVIGGSSRDLGTVQLSSGGIASLIRLQTLDHLGTLTTLETLTHLERSQFYGPKAQNNYALSSFWIRYFMSGTEETLQRGFRAYLADIATGTEITDEMLLGHLGVGWDDLEIGFRDWLRSD